ncbi:sedoheptulose 7-phosphate cyclase [Streptomyces olivaceoviridis]|uniref:sedoheptulose 7-phosphate cyclase n=1 Tax=Streptomyces olivaceoviridis TaxID=1921 RepID=UPI0036F9744B
MPPSRWTVSTRLDVRYDIRETPGLLDPANPTLADILTSDSRGGLRLVLVDHAVARLYGARIEQYLKEYNISHRLLELSGDENRKTMGQVLGIISALNDVGTLRVSDAPVAIGGGVVLDVVGLAASLYRRGIPHTRIPTTLLAQVDVSVAAKTGVNYQGYRNRIGSYNPPPLTLIDPTFLRTVSARHISNGAGEIFKMGLIKDAALFELLERGGPALVAGKFQSTTAAEAIGRAIAGMIDELENNLWEKELRRAVDHGHSFSPLVEMRHVHELLHGEAVALDCLLSAVIAHGRGYLGHHTIDRIAATAAGLGLRTWHPAFGDTALLTQALTDTMRHRNGNQNLPVVREIGRATFLNDVSTEEISDAAQHMRRLGERQEPKLAHHGTNR